MSVKNKQNSSANFLVRALFLTARSLDRIPARPPLVIYIYPTALMAGAGALG